MNDTFRQRLVGLAVLLVLVFLLSLLLPGKPTPEEAEPTTTVSITGEQLLTEADAVPPPDDLLPEPATEPMSDAVPPAESTVAISDVESIAEPPPAAAPLPALKLAPTVGSNRPQDTAEPKPEAKPPTVAAVTPKPKLAESVARPAAAPKQATATPGWYVQVGSFSQLGSAQTIVTLLKKLGVSAAITRINGVKGNPLNRVRAGPYASEAAAKSALAKIARNGYPQARIVHEPSH